MHLSQAIAGELGDSRLTLSTPDASRVRPRCRPSLFKSAKSTRFSMLGVRTLTYDRLRTKMGIDANRPKSRKPLIINDLAHLGHSGAFGSFQRGKP